MIITIPGNPIPAARPRVTSTHTYNPKSTLMHKISQIIKAQWPAPPLNCPVSLTLRFFMPIPKSLSIKKQLRLSNTPHTKRPDLDNLCKQYLDASNNIIFKDDSLVYKIYASKVYSDNPRTEIDLQWTLIPNNLD